MPFYAYIAMVTAVISLVGIIISLIFLMRASQTGKKQVNEPDIYNTIDSRLENIMTHTSQQQGMPVNNAIPQRSLYLTLENVRDGSRASAEVINTIVIGRSYGCEISVNDFYISGRHCRVNVENGRLYVEDLNSTNGTFLNGIRITGRALLSNNDVLSLGNAGYKVYIR